MCSSDLEGASFRSYKDGSNLFLSPESAMDIQRKLGPDFVEIGRASCRERV